MPSNCFARLSGTLREGVQRSILGKEGGIQDSLEVLIGGGKLLFGNTRLLHSAPFAAFPDLRIFTRPGTLAASQSNLHRVYQRKYPSVVGALSRTSSIPSVSGPSYQVCGYHVDRLLSKHSHFSLGVDTEMMHVAVSPSRAFSADCSFSSLTFRHGQPRVSTNNSFISFSNRSFDSCSRASIGLRRKEQPDKFLRYTYFIYNVGNRSSSSNPYQAFGLKGFNLSSLVFFSAGTAPDVSFDNSGREEQITNSADSSERNISGNRTLKLNSGSCYLPHPDKEETGGEDAHFVCADEQAIGVADGVGGWADLGVDAGQYARELMSNSVTAIHEEPKGSINPARVLEKAYSSTKAKGSSTACIIALTDQVFTIPVAPGDVIIAGTDGLFDNLCNSDITAVVVHAMRAGLGPRVTAQKIAALAQQRAQDKNRQTPFSAAAQDAGFRYYGGKLDDITVIVSYIAGDNNGYARLAPFIFKFKENSSACSSNQMTA